MNGWLPSLAAFVSLSVAISAQAPMDKGRMGLPLTEVMRPWTGDLNGMAERRMVRVLTAFSKTQYFVDRGTPRGTAYDQGMRLEAHLNTRLTSAGKPPVELTPAPEELEDEDLLEMASADLVDIVVVDNHKAWFWQRVWPSPKVYPGAALRKGGEIAWAIRKDSPQLETQLNGFLAANGRDSLNGRMIVRRYLLNTQYVKGASAEAARKRFNPLVALFRKYGAQYEMDWMLMAAQGYQESRLDHAARSHVGAVGVMQVMPATGKELNVGDITVLEPNIHAGVKYIRSIVDRYYAKEPMDDLNKVLFAFAAYNAGPGRVRQLRREATARGSTPTPGSTTSSALPASASAARR